MLETVVFRHGDGQAEAAGFEGAGGVRTFFFDVEAGVALAVEHGRPAFAESDGSYVGQDAGIAPHAEARGRGGRASGDVFTLCGLAELVHVVTDVERARAEGAEGLGSFGRDVMVATGALERSNGGHISDVTVKAVGWPSGRDRYARRGHFVTCILLRLALPLVTRRFVPTIGRPGRSRYTCHEVTAARAGRT
jgi:hypothetical protein